MKYFENKENPTVNELVYWFQVEFTKLANEMKESNHAAVPSEPNPYHIEDTVWTHTMMVCQRAEIFDVPKVNKICALLHDCGKPMARETIPFETKKPIHTESNEIRNDGINNGKNSGLNRVMPSSGLKTHFRGHEGLSFYLAVEPLIKLHKLGVIDRNEMQECLTIISMHGTLFDNIDADGEMRKPHKVFEKFEHTSEGLKLFNALIVQVKCDSLGRFFMSKDGRKNNALRLGEDIYTEEQFLEYHNNILTPEYKDEPVIEVLVGCPGSGKSTYLEDKCWSDENYPVFISRDETLLSYGKGKYIGNYSEIWKQLTDADQKEIDQILERKFQGAVRNRKNIIVDMTNMSNKSQRKWVNKAGVKYKAIATVFATSYQEVQRRLKKRELETGKSIPDYVVDTMMKGYMTPNYSNFSDVKFVF